ncbi:MAG: dynamin family protein, partial [Chloroflexota bacterium]
EEYQAWPAAINEARAALRDSPGTTAESAPTPRSARALVPADTAFPFGDAKVRYSWFREQLVPLLMACGAKAHELGVRGAPVIQADYPLDSPICRIVVAGEFSRGKSTVINALFGIHGEIALPTGMTPTTPLACAIRVPRVGETDGATIAYRGGRPARDLTIEQFRAGVRLAEEGASAAGDQTAPDLHLGEARRVEVRITGAYLPAGVEIEDTPGLNEQAGRSAGALAALGRADLVLFVLAADQLLGDLERDIIFNTLAAGRHRNVLFLINFWDTIEDDGQRAALLQRAGAALGSFPTPFHGQEAVPGLPHVFTLSALRASRAQRQHKPAPEDSGVPVLRSHLRELLGPGSEALLLRARIGRSLRYCALLKEAVSGAAAHAQAEAEGRADGQAGGLSGASEAALRVAKSLGDVVEAAIGRPLARLSDAELPSAQDSERARMTVVRVAMGDVTRAAGQAMDLVLAQARAAYLSRGIQAPAFDAAIDSPISIPPPAGLDESWAAYRERVARLALTTLVARAQAAQVTLAAEIGTPAQERHPAARTGSQAQAAALRMLEEDVLRLERVLADALF